MDGALARQAFLALAAPLDVPAKEWPKTLVHYTRGQTFLSILETRSLLFSSSSVMNDADEVWGALEIIRETLSPSAAYKQWAAAMQAAWPEFIAAFETYFNQSVWHDKDNLYLFCMCANSDEHPEGKLSMWRAYGADGRGVAISLRTETMLKHRYEATLPIQLHRTRYENDADFCATLIKIANVYLQHVDIAKAIASQEGMDDACWWLFQAWFVASATRKHPGFSEEEEWRFIYMPRWDGDSVLSGGLEVRPVGDQLRPCFRLPIVDYAAYGMPGTDIKDILDCVFVGPNTSDLLSASKAVEMLLQRAGVADAPQKVRICRTPYRPSR